MGSEKKNAATERRRIGIKELEERLHASRSTISRWVKSGRLEAPHYFGARRLWFVDQIEKFEATATAAREPKTASAA